MADDPVTLTLVDSWTIQPGLKMAVLTMAGPADYDASGGAACDLSTWFDDIYFVAPPCCTDAQADALIDAKYYNAAFGTSSAGFFTFSWTGAGASAVFANVTDTTNLSSYTWRILVVGTQVAAA